MKAKFEANNTVNAQYGSDRRLANVTIDSRRPLGLLLDVREVTPCYHLTEFANVQFKAGDAKPVSCFEIVRVKLLLFTAPTSESALTAELPLPCQQTNGLSHSLSPSQLVDCLQLAI